MVEEGFVKADSPTEIRYFMVAEFIRNGERFNAAEIRLVKEASLSSREAYGDTAVGYVCLRRESSLCTINEKICPEHRVRNKNYTLSVEVNTENEVIENVICEDCTAFLGDCKHALAFLMWLHRKSEHRSPTEVECYWNTPVLGTVSTTKKHIKVTEMCQSSSNSVQDLPDNTAFLNNILMKAEEKQLDSQLSRLNFILAERELYLLSLQQDNTSINDFMEFVTFQQAEELCLKIEKETRSQSDCLLWHELRYGRITGSVLYEAAHCRTSDGSLIQKLLGTSKKFDTMYTERGRNLENSVLSVVEKCINKKLKKCGLIFATNTKKALFYVADPDFEKSNLVNLMWIDFNSEYVNNLIMSSATIFGKKMFIVK